MDERIYELVEKAGRRGAYRRRGVERTKHQERRDKRGAAKKYNYESWEDLDKKERQQGRGVILHPRNVAGDDLDVLERQSASDFDFSDITGFRKARVRSRLARHAYGRKQEMRQWRYLREMDKYPEGSLKWRRAQKKFADAKTKFQTIVQKARTRSPLAAKKYQKRQEKRLAGMPSHTAQRQWWQFDSKYSDARDKIGANAKNIRKAQNADLLLRKAFAIRYRFVNGR